MTTTQSEPRADAPRIAGTRQRDRRFPTGGGISLGRLFGVEVQIDWSLLPA